MTACDVPFKLRPAVEVVQRLRAVRQVRFVIGVFEAASATGYVYVIKDNVFLVSGLPISGKVRQA